MLIAAGALLAGFVGGWLVGDGDRAPDVASEELVATQQQQEDLAAELHTTRQRAEDAERRAEEAERRAEEAGS